MSRLNEGASGSGYIPPPRRPSYDSSIELNISTDDDENKNEKFLERRVTRSMTKKRTFVKIRKPLPVARKSTAKISKISKLDKKLQPLVLVKKLDTVVNLYPIASQEGSINMPMAVCPSCKTTLALDGPWHKDQTVPDVIEKLNLCPHVYHKSCIRQLFKPRIDASGAEEPLPNPICCVAERCELSIIYQNESRDEIRFETIKYALYGKIFVHDELESKKEISNYQNRAHVAETHVASLNNTVAALTATNNDLQNSLKMEREKLQMLQLRVNALETHANAPPGIDVSELARSKVLPTSPLMNLYSAANSSQNTAEFPRPSGSNVPPPRSPATFAAAANQQMMVQLQPQQLASLQAQQAAVAAAHQQRMAQQLQQQQNQPQQAALMQNVPLQQPNPAANQPIPQPNQIVQQYRNLQQENQQMLNQLANEHENVHENDVDMNIHEANQRVLNDPEFFNPPANQNVAQPAANQPEQQQPVNQPRRRRNRAGNRAGRGVEGAGRGAGRGGRGAGRGGRGAPNQAAPARNQAAQRLQNVRNANNARRAEERAAGNVGRAGRNQRQPNVANVNAEVAAQVVNNPPGPPSPADDAADLLPFVLTGQILGPLQMVNNGIFPAFSSNTFIFMGNGVLLDIAEDLIAFHERQFEGATTSPIFNRDLTIGQLIYNLRATRMPYSAVVCIGEIDTQYDGLSREDCDRLVLAFLTAAYRAGIRRIVFMYPTRHTNERRSRVLFCETIANYVRPPPGSPEVGIYVMNREIDEIVNRYDSPMENVNNRLRYNGNMISEILVALNQRTHRWHSSRACRRVHRRREEN